jgi:surfeit locus 1 family protein
MPLPISLNIQNDHKEYAITWFSLALVWFLMTIYLLWRIKQKTV